jgi:hypothetical protein
VVISSRIVVADGRVSRVQCARRNCMNALYLEEQPADSLMSQLSCRLRPIEIGRVWRVLDRGIRLLDSDVQC